MTPRLPIDLRKSFNLPIWTSSSGIDRLRHNAGKLKVSELASREFLLDFGLKIFEFDLDPIIYIAVVHVLLGEKTGLSLALFGLVLNLSFTQFLVLNCPLVGRGTDVPYLSIFELALTDT